MIMLLRFASVFLLMLITGMAATAQERDYRPVQGTTREVPKDPEPQAVEKPERQKPESTGKWDWEHFRVGGNLGFGFGPQTFIDVSPSFGYFIQPGKLQVGIGTRLMYFSQRDSLLIIDPFGRAFVSSPFKTLFYGGSVFTNYNVWNGLVLHGEIEMINRQWYNTTIEGYERIWVPHLLVGAGYTQPMGRAGNFFILALFNVLDRDESIYAGSFGNLPLILRTGFGFGFPGRR